MQLLALSPIALLPTAHGTFYTCVHKDAQGLEHMLLWMGDLQTPEPVLCRLHSECLTGDALGSLRCDCGPQLQFAMQRIASEGRGIIAYLRQEGRGIGLSHKIHAYHLQDRGADTVEANVQLGLPVDERDYQLAAHLLQQLGIRRVRLMTNNPRKVAALEQFGITVAAREPHKVHSNAHNEHYLATKADKLGHML